MARAFTAAERALIQLSRYRVYAKMELSSPDGIWVNLSTGLDGGSTDWWNGGTVDDSIDAHCMTMQASLLRDMGLASTNSLSPLMETSELNRDLLDVYAPFLDVGRSWRVLIAVVPPGTVPNANQYRKISEGIVDRVMIDDPERTITITGRDPGASLVDRIIDAERTYAGKTFSNTDWGNCTITGGGVTVTFSAGTLQTDGLVAGMKVRFTDLSVGGNNGVWVEIANVNSETEMTLVAGLANNVADGNYSVEIAEPLAFVLQEIIDDNGFTGITLLDDTDPTFFVDRALTISADQSVMEALNVAARSDAAVVRYRYDASDVMQLTMYRPDREAVSEDWELGPGEYVALPRASIDISGVRNDVRVKFWNTDDNAEDEVTAVDAASIARYGGPEGIHRILWIDLSENTNITTEARAQVFADAVLADLKDPPFLQEIETPAFWLPQISDFGKFLANGVHYDTDQYGGVTALTFRLEAGTLMTTVRAGGQPRGKYRTWLTAYAPPGPNDVNTLLCSAKVQNTTTTQVTARVRVADAVPGNGDIAVTYGAVGCTVDSPASPQSIASALVTDDVETTGYVDVVVNRAASGSGTGRVVFIVRRNGRVVATDAVDVPEQASTGSGVDRLAARFVQTLLDATELHGDIQVIDSSIVTADAITLIDREPPSTSRLLLPTDALKGVGTGTPTNDYSTTGTVSIELSRPGSGSGDATERFIVLAKNRTPVEFEITVPEQGAVPAVVSDVVVSLVSDVDNTVLVSYSASGDFDHVSIKLNSGAYTAADDQTVIDVGVGLGYDLNAAGPNIRTITATVELHDASHAVLDSADSAPTNFGADDDI